MHAFIEVAEGRRQDLLADAARARLAKQAQPDQFLALRSKTIVGIAARTMCASARATLDGFSFSFRPSGVKREQTLLTIAR